MPKLRTLSIVLVGMLAGLIGALGSPAGFAADRVAAGPQQGACEPQPVVPIEENFFTYITAQSGIDDENQDPDIPPTDHSRLGFVDLDGDGYDDIVTHNMRTRDNPNFEHLIYRNKGDGTFESWSDESGLRHSQSAFLAFGDIDNDGDQDCFAGVDAEGGGDLGLSNHIFLNDGQGHFTLKENSGVEGPPTRRDVAGNAVFADFNGDTLLDLFVGYGATSAQQLNQLPDRLYFGNGDGTFVDVTENLQPVRYRLSNGSVACDYDNDNDLDIFVSVYGVSHQNGANVLWENDGEGNFTDVARERGFESLATGNYYLYQTGYGRDPEPGKGPGEYIGSNGFGLQCADVNSDGLMDVWATTISHPVDHDYSRKWSDPTQLLINQGPDSGYSFVNVYLDVGIPFNEGDLDGAAVDFDNDSFVDVSVSRESKYEPNYFTPEQLSWFGLMHQQPDGMFESVGLVSGINDVGAPPSPLPRARGGHQHAWSDIDHDGDLDLLVGSLRASRPNWLFRNEIGSQNAWLAIRIQGDGENVNRDGIGTRVELQYAERTLRREVKSSRGMFNSMDTRVLYFGLGELGCAPEVKVTWPDGAIYRFDGTAFGQNAEVTIAYGDGERIEPTPTATLPPSPTPTQTPIVFPTSPPTKTPGPRNYVYLPRLDNGIEEETSQLQSPRP